MKLYCDVLLPIVVIILLPIMPMETEKPKEIPAPIVYLDNDDSNDIEYLVKSGYSPEEISTILGDE